LTRLYPPFLLSDVSIDVSKMMAQKSKSVSGLTKGIEGLFKKNKVTYAKGWGSLTSTPGEVVVAKEDGTTETISTKNVILATGSEPASLPGVDVDEETVVTSTGALALTEVPKRMVVIGGGVIGLELGSVWGRLGAEVTVVEFAKDICPPMDAQVRKTFQRALKKQGFDFKMEKKVTSAKKLASGAIELTVEPSAGGDAETLEADVVLVATGRKPYTSGLGLDAAGVETNARGQVVVDMHTYATNKPGVYAIGDIVEGPMLAHKAEEEGISCVEQLAGKPGHVNYDVIPSIIYTHPEVAWCGKTEEEVKASGAEYNVGTFPFAANSRARTNDDSEGLVKFVSCAKTDKILGAHIVGPQAGELLGECVLAMEYGASTEDVARTCHGHPTLSEAVKEAALATGGKPIHF
jgi:dihydrolipoamide dehydrogenase